MLTKTLSRLDHYVRFIFENIKNYLYLLLQALNNPHGNHVTGNVYQNNNHPHHQPRGQQHQHLRR